MSTLVGPLTAPQRWQPAPTVGVCGCCNGVYQRGALVHPDGSWWRCLGCWAGVSAEVRDELRRAA